MDFLQPTTWAEALEAKAAHRDAVPIAGGTDVMVGINFGRLRPSLLLDLTRVPELQQWAAGGEYRAILAGDYLRREDDADAPISEDVRAAAASYQRSFTSSSDPLVGLVGKIGSAVGSVGGFAANRMRDWWQSQGGSPSS